MKAITITLILVAGTFELIASEKPKLKSELNEGDKQEIVLKDVTGDGKPDILEAWWNGKRCRWFDENGNMKPTDRRGDMVGDSMQVDMDGNGVYDSHEDMSIKWSDSDADGQADLVTVAINPGEDQKNIWGKHSHYMHFIDLDNDGVNHYVNWENFSFDAWRHTGRCNFSPDYNGNSIFIKTHLPPWSLKDPRTNWENPFCFYDFDDDGCTEMAIRFLNHGTKRGKIEHEYSGVVKTVQLAYDLDNDSQNGNEQSFDLSIGYWHGEGIDYSKYAHKFPTLKAPAWVLPYYQYTNYREIDELVYMPHELCYEKTMQGKWKRSEIAFDEDGDDHRWERVCIYQKGDPYIPHDRKNSKNGSVVRGVQVDTLGDRTEWDDDYSGKGKLYIGQWDNKLHLYGAESGVWLVDDGSHSGSGNAPRASSRKIATKVGEVVLYTDTDKDGFIDKVEFDYDGNETVDLAVNLKIYKLPKPELIDPASKEWKGLHETFKSMAKKSWNDAQQLYRAAWRAGLTSPELDELAIASSTWEKYDHGYWLKARIFRMLHKKFKNNSVRQKALEKAYFTSDFTAFANLIGE